MAITGISSSPTGQLWAAIVARVRANTAVMDAVKLAQFYEGRTSDLDKWTTATLPAIRFTPQGGGSKWSAEVQHDAPLIVKVELIVNSTTASDVMDLWWAIVAVFFPGDNSVLNSLRTYGCYLISMTDPAWDAQSLDDGTRVLAATGAFKFDQHLNT